MFRCRWVGVAGAVVVLAGAMASCGPAKPAGPALSAEDKGLLAKARAGGGWNGEAMPGLTLEQTERQVVYEAKISAVIAKLIKDPSKTSANEFGSVSINTDGVADLPTILGEAGFKDYMANVKAINLARAAEASRRGGR